MGLFAFSAMPTFWDIHDDRPLMPSELTGAKPEPLPRQPTVDDCIAVAETNADRRCSQDDLHGICDYCHCERDDVLLGICADCD